MTLFEKIIAREIPATIEYETDEIIVIHDISPKAKIHLLIIPKKPIPTVQDISVSDTELMGKLFCTAKHLAKIKGIEGYSLRVNVGKKGGQEVFHIHMHMLADE